MFKAIATNGNKFLIAAFVSGAILSASGATQAVAGEGGEGGGREDVMISMTSPDGTRDTLRGHRDGSRTFTRTKRGKVVFKKRIRKAKKAKRQARRDRRASMSITNPDGTRTSVRRNRDGSSTVENFDRNGNRISSRTTPPRRAGTWSARGTNHTTGRSGIMVGNAAGAVVSIFGFGLGF